ncbi:MAG: glutamyl-tRNA amidotransferase [Firmicutes bacterium]|nr:glutamyl-tRNA amidotransferase [Bacillota bacterium]
MIRKKYKKIEKRLKLLNFGVVLLTYTINVYAASDPLTVIDNLSNFMFALIRGVGVILAGSGIVQFGLSFKSHDPSQRANGVLGIVGGIIIICTKEILNIITG